MSTALLRLILCTAWCIYVDPGGKSPALYAQALNFIPKELDYQGHPVSPHDPVERFYPVGWSLDSKLAYVRVRWEDGKGSHIWSFTIQYMKSDEIIWNYLYDRSEDAEFDGEMDIETFWKRHESMFLDSLKSHGIHPTKDFMLEPVSFQHNGRQYETTVDTLKKYDEGFGLTSITSVSVTVMASGLGKKEVYRISKTGFTGIMSAAVVGHLLSPFEERIAILYVESHWGWEGPPNPTVFKLIGCHLKLGFK